jgi:hypothetical protein
VKYVYLLRVTFEAPDDVAARECLHQVDGGAHTTDRVKSALLTLMHHEFEVSEKLQRVKDNDQPRLVRRYR